MHIVAAILLFSTAAFVPNTASTSEPGALGTLAISEHEAGVTAEAQEDDQSAVVHYRKALALWPGADGPRVANRIVTLINLGGVYRRLHKYDDAETSFSEAARLAGLSEKLDPLVRATLLERSAWLDSDIDRQDAALDKARRAQALLERLPSGRKELARTFDTLGILQLRSGIYGQAETSLRKAVTLAAEVMGDDDIETAGYMTDLALALTIERKLSGAETLLRRSRFVIEAHLGAESLRLVPVFEELGAIQRETGKFQLAEANTERALAILVHRFPYESPEVILTEVNLGSIYLREKKLQEAERLLTPALNAERSLYKSGRTLADGLRTLAVLRVRENRPEEAATLYREAIALYESSIGGDHPDVAPVLLEYAAVLKQVKGSKTEIRTLQTRAHAIQSRSAHES